MTPVSRCTCVNIKIGSYANQETRLLPFATPRWPTAGTKLVGIDRCCLADVEAMWARGIETVESCCGHGVTSGYVLVTPEHVDVRRAVGYRSDPLKSDRSDLFLWPKAR